MPAKSKAQLRFMYAHMEDRDSRMKKVAKEYVESTHSTKNMPEYKSSKIAKKRGRPRKDLA